MKMTISTALPRMLTLTSSARWTTTDRSSSSQRASVFSGIVRVAREKVSRLSFILLFENGKRFIVRVPRIGFCVPSSFLLGVGRPVICPNRIPRSFSGSPHRAACVLFISSFDILFIAFIVLAVCVCNGFCHGFPFCYLLFLIQQPIRKILQKACTHDFFGQFCYIDFS